MGDRRFTSAAYASTAESVRSEGGSATKRGEQRHKEGKGLDPLVDPKALGGIRRSLNRVEKVKGGYKLLIGTAMLKETRFDTTGSMGRNVQLAFDALPRSYHLLKEVSGAPLARYDLQIINSIFGDVVDDYVLCRSQAEMCEKIAEQMRLMVPEGGGGDSAEDPQYGLFGAAYLTAADIVQVGLKSYDFTVTDAPGREHLDASTLIRVFGDEVFDRVNENGHQINRRKLPTTEEVVQDLLKISHAFLIQVENTPSVHRFWKEIYGEDRIIVIPDVRHLPEVEAVIIGLTEGTLGLQEVEKFLRKNAEMSATNATAIMRGVANIPLKAQALLPNFDRVPLAGALFKTKGDAWPIDDEGDGAAGLDSLGRDGAKGGKKPAGKVWD
jgi:hypothetical protein